MPGIAASGKAICWALRSLSPIGRLDAISIILFGHKDTVQYFGLSDGLIASGYEIGGCVEFACQVSGRGDHIFGVLAFCCVSGVFAPLRWWRGNCLGFGAGVGPGQELVDAGGRPEVDEFGEGVGKPGLRIDVIELGGLD